MRRAIELATMGLGYTSPNPCVGCVIVVDGQIIGEGWHKVYGGPHAEVEAVNTLEDKSILSRATVYVTLEPCSHHGNTPPCADMLVRYNTKKVVIATIDTNPLVAGQGIQKLKDGGVEVVVGVLEDEARWMNRRFFTAFEKKRPYIILKWAQTADAYIARTDHTSKWISNKYSRQLVHRWRSEEDAILVGSGTVKHDNPALSVREWTGRNPIRVVIDRQLKLDRNLKIFIGDQPTLCYNLESNAIENNTTFVQLDQIEFVYEMMQDLFRKNIQSLIVEGGKQTLDLFIGQSLWDEARIFTADHAFGMGIEAPVLRGKLLSSHAINEDRLDIYSP